MSTAHFSVVINGESHAFFPSSKGVRQGGSLSPCLFVLAMKGLRGILRQAFV
jgi:hypothetical protein